LRGEFVTPLVLLNLCGVANFQFIVAEGGKRAFSSSTLPPLSFLPNDPIMMSVVLCVLALLLSAAGVVSLSRAHGAFEGNTARTILLFGVCAFCVPLEKEGRVLFQTLRHRWEWCSFLAGARLAGHLFLARNSGVSGEPRAHAL
jgi:hypothetical protein